MYNLPLFPDVAHLHNELSSERLQAGRHIHRHQADFPHGGLPRHPGRRGPRRERQLQPHPPAHS